MMTALYGGAFDERLVQWIDLCCPQDWLTRG